MILQETQWWPSTLGSLEEELVLVLPLLSNYQWHALLTNDSQLVWKWHFMRPMVWRQLIMTLCARDTNFIYNEEQRKLSPET